MDKELRTALKTFEETSQQIADSLNSHIKKNQECLKVQFPKNVIRKLESHYDRWPYLTEDRKRTVACTLQLCDVNRWHLNVWKIGLTAGTMWEWHCTVPVIAVIETLSYEYVCQYKLANKNIKFKKVIDTLGNAEIIEKGLMDQLHELREYRNNIHLYLREEVEMYEGKPRKYNNSIRALHNLEAALNCTFK